MRRAILALALISCAPLSVLAQDEPTGLPPGHPPLAPPGPSGADELPPGHPSTEGQAPAGELAPGLPPGHPSTEGQAPAGELAPGHPAQDTAHAGADGLPPGHPAIDGTQGTMPPGRTSGAGQLPGRMGQVMGPPQMGSAQPSSEVPAGSVRVLVVDESGEPVSDAAVDVGSLAEGERSRFNARTNSDGIATFDGLGTGSSQHYRVNVPYLGATYSTMPFALPTDRGYTVRIVRLPVTQDDSFVFFHIYRVVIEQSGERMHVIQQGGLTNAGSETYVFPASGQRAALPEDATSFQFQRVMTDQRIEEIDDEHAYAMRGSLPPGTVNLAWTYDLPAPGGDLEVPIEFPMRYFTLQVIVEALPELEVAVSGGLPRAERLDTQGESCADSVASEGCAWVTQIRLAPTDSLERIAIRLSGIPGPGPVRWIAAGFALLFLFASALFYLTMGDSRGNSAASRAKRREELLAEAAELARDFENGDVGPEHRNRLRAEIVRELAVLLYAEEVDKAREDEEANVEPPVERSGAAAFLTPSPESVPGLRYLEIALTVLSSPLLVFGVVLLVLRPRAALAMQGQGEAVIALTLGTFGATGMWLLGALALHWPDGATWTVIGVTSVALLIRTIIRRAPSARGAPLAE